MQVNARIRHLLFQVSALQKALSKWLENRRPKLIWEAYGKGWINTSINDGNPTVTRNKGSTALRSAEFPGTCCALARESVVNLLTAAYVLQVQVCLVFPARGCAERKQLPTFHTLKVEKGVPGWTQTANLSVNSRTRSPIAPETCAHCCPGSPQRAGPHSALGGAARLCPDGFAGSRVSQNTRRPVDAAS